LNILMVCPYFYSKTHHIKLRPDIYEVSRRLTQRGHRIIVLTSKTYGAPTYEVVDDVEVYRVWSVPLPKIYYFIPIIPMFMTIMFKLIRKYSVEIVHFWNYEYLTSVLSLLSRKKLRNIPFVMTIIGFPGLNWKYGVKIIDFIGLIYTYTIGKAILKAVDHVIVLGKNLVRYATWMGVKRDKISINSFGIDLQEFKPRKRADEIRKELGVPPDEIVISFVGRLEPVKGVKYLLKAAEAVCKKAEHVTFLLVGDGPLKSEIKLNLYSKIIFTGWRNDVADILNASDILILPSLSEGLPLSVLEAYALGKPVIASNVGAVSGVVIDCYSGLLVPSRDWKQLANAILCLISNPTLAQEMGKRGRAIIETNYNWHNILEKYERIYRHLLNRVKVKT